MSVAPFENPEIDSIARRTEVRFGRVGLEIPVEIMINDAPSAGVTRNISPAGAFVATERRLPVGARIRLRLEVPNYAVPFAVEAEVRWLRVTVWPAGDDRSAGMGVQFVDPPIGLSLCLAQLVGARAT